MKEFSTEEGRAASKSPHLKFGYFFSMSHQAVSANIIPSGGREEEEECRSVEEEEECRRGDVEEWKKRGNEEEWRKREEEEWRKREEEKECRRKEEEEECRRGEKDEWKKSEEEKACRRERSRSGGRERIRRSGGRKRRRRSGGTFYRCGVSSLHSSSACCYQCKNVECSLKFCSAFSNPHIMFSLCKFFL